MSMARSLLLPMVPLYRLALTAKELRLEWGWERVRQLPNPVISIGNLSTGGAGKTPFTIALAGALSHRGFAVDILSRGYGRRSRKAARVDPDGSAELFGDEPLLIARSTGLPVFVAPQRYEAGMLAASLTAKASETAGKPNAPDIRLLSELGAGTIHLLDDGFQHRQLARNIDILLVSRADWRDRLLPAGNLREPLAAARRAGAIVIPAEDSKFELDLRASGWDGPVWRMRRVMEVPTLSGPAVAFCGIARPRQFFAGLKAKGMALADAIAYPDHHRYTSRNLESIAIAARACRATALVTTEKDLVRLGELSKYLAKEFDLRTASLHVVLEEEAAAIDWLVARVSSAKSHIAM